MNPTRLVLTLAPLWLLLAAPLQAQRGSSAPRPSSQAPRPSAPAPRPSAQAPRPSAPRPSAQAPRPSAPRPQASAPRPSAPPRVSAPAPRPSATPPPRSSTPNPRPSTPNARVSPPPSRVGTPAPQVGRPPQGAAPIPVRTPGNSPAPSRYQPSPGAPTPRQGTRGDGRAPNATPPATRTPTPGNRYVPAPARDNARTPTPGNRYTPAPPRDNARAPTPGLAPRGDRSPARTAPSDGSPRPSVARTRYDGSTRTAPADTVPTRTTRGNTPVAPSAGQRRGAVSPTPTGPRAPTNSAVANPRRADTSAVPRLVPRSGAATLVTPRANVRPVQSGQVAAVRGGFGGGYGHVVPRYNGVFQGWWDPWCAGPWNGFGFRSRWPGGLGFAGWNTWNTFGWNNWGWNGCSSFGLGWSLWSPWWTIRSTWWDACYNTGWYFNTLHPLCAPTSFWWYPSTVYCPTYLTVPSTVLVVDRGDTVLPASDGSDLPTSSTTSSVPAPANVNVDTVVAGAPSQGSVRMVEVPAGATSEEMAQSLATKYTELGDFYFRANRFPDAAEAYGKARGYAPDDAPLHFVLADAAFASGDYHYAAFLIGEGLRIDPSLATANTDKRAFYGEPQTFAAQMRSLDGYLARKPYDAHGHLVRGYNLRFSGDRAGAEAAFARVLEIEPDNRPARTFLSALREPARAGDDR